MNKNGYEIERKFLIKYPCIEKLTENPLCRQLKMEQVYLEDGARIRRIEENGKETFIKTVKRRISHIKREEKEWEIEKAEFESELKNQKEGTCVIKKTRYAYPIGDLVAEIDVFPFWDDRAFLEVELESENQEFFIPSFIEIIKEVTSDKRYTNAALSKEICNEDIF